MHPKKSEYILSINVREKPYTKNWVYIKSEKIDMRIPPMIPKQQHPFRV
jgi:hypothetical protein